MIISVHSIHSYFLRLFLLFFLIIRYLLLECKLILSKILPVLKVEVGLREEQASFLDCLHLWSLNLTNIYHFFHTSYLSPILEARIKDQVYKPDIHFFICYKIGKHLSFYKCLDHLSTWIQWKGGSIFYIIAHNLISAFEHMGFLHSIFRRPLENQIFTNLAYWSHFWLPYSFIYPSSSNNSYNL